MCLFFRESAHLNVWSGHATACGGQTVTTMMLHWVLLDAHDGIIAIDSNGLVELVVMTPISLIVAMVLMLSIAAASLLLLLLIQVEI